MYEILILWGIRMQYAYGGDGKKIKKERERQKTKEIKLSINDKIETLALMKGHLTKTK